MVCKRFTLDCNW